MDVPGATTEVATLKRALSEAEDKAAKECIEREKQEARVGEVHQELQALAKKHESLELDSKTRESELAKALESAQNTKAEAHKALQEIEAVKKIAAGKAFIMQNKHVKESFLHMLALHNECLIRRYLLDRLNLLEGLLGFGLGTLCTLKGRGKLGLSRLRVKLQGLVFLLRASSSCCTSPTRASCFSRSMRSLAALSSASDSAFFRVATSIVASDRFIMILLLTTEFLFNI